MIRMESLRGVKAPRCYQHLANFMNVMINVRTNDAFWDDALAMAWQFDRKGKVIPSQDIIIAACAMRLGTAILTSDTHFRTIEGLEVIAPPNEWFPQPVPYRFSVATGRALAKSSPCLIQKNKEPSASLSISEPVAVV